MESIIRNCKVHGETSFFVQKNGHSRCRKCRTNTTSEYRRKSKRKLIDLFGGKCQRCGYDKSNRALSFHHVDPKTKEFSVSSNTNVIAFEKLLEEAKKCILLCANCHAEIEDEIFLSKLN